MSTREEELLRQVWNNYYGDEFLRRQELATGDRLTWEFFTLEDSFAYDIVRSLHPMPEAMAAALDCWRNKMVAVIDEKVQHLKAEAAETPTPAWILDR
jgi:hypothetical protein